LEEISPGCTKPKSGLKKAAWILCIVIYATEH
jgi:hypothetical protein